MMVKMMIQVTISVKSNNQKDGLICIGHLSMFVKKVTINCRITFSYGLTNIESKTKLIFNRIDIDLLLSATKVQEQVTCTGQPKFPDVIFLQH